MPYFTSRETAPVDLEVAKQLGIEGIKAWWLLNRDNAGTTGLEFHMAQLPPGFAHELHRHPNAGEIVFILEGEGVHLQEGKEPRPQKAGDITYIPAGEWHGLRNNGDTPLLVVGISDGVTSYDEAGYEDHPDVLAAKASA